MDKVIERFPFELDGDLKICDWLGVAYQADMTHRVAYDEQYFNKCLGYEDKAIALAINRGRIDMVAKHYDPAGEVVDVGIGSGEFIKKRPNTLGHDINPAAIRWLKKEGLWAADLAGFQAFTFWDVLEHVEEPEEYLSLVPIGGWLFTSIPIFEDLRRIRESRHYRPGEHLYYWTAEGFSDWMRLHGFTQRDHQTFEMEAGRDSIHSFAFRKT